MRDAAPEDFGRLVAAARSWKGLSKMRLAGKAGVSYTYVAAIENGSRVPPEGTRARLAAALGCTLDQLEALGRELARRLV